MKRTIITLAILLLCRLALAQGISVETAKFRVGDNPAWASPSFNDTSWDVLRLDTDWNAQGIDNDNAYGWYRLHVVIPSSLKGRDSDKILLALGTIDDADETFLNGVLVGKTDGYDSPRRYIVDRKLVRWDKENVIAVRVYNGDPPGGFYGKPAWITLVSGPYILTPPAPATPRYNGPAVLGVRPGSPVIFRLAFSGEKPMRYAVEGLPEGIVLDSEKGVLSGSVKEEGDYPLVLKARNAKGSASASFTLKVGSRIALTPPMGWNSWNCWGTSVSQKKVMESAMALVSSGLADYGYSYVNVDDAWEAAERNPDGTIGTNENFPDMKGLGDWLHGNGLKFGIYSSPGDRTCGGYLGSLGHEKEDAEVWNSWGVDYLKYDWCGYSKVYGASSDHSVAALLRPYIKMQQYLREQPRDIFYSLCQYGMGNVWEWGAFVDANSWRTTVDITDTWESVRSIGFEQQDGLHPYSGPGHWNDPDMLVVGKVGWSDNLRDSRLTPDEQYSHISLWALLAANMLIGCDLSRIDDFTLNLLCNNEVNAINQDVLGRQAHKDIEEDGIEIWSRELSDGGIAIGIFNLNEAPVPVYLGGAIGKIDLEADSVRDLWRQKDIPTEATYTVPSHGVLLVKMKTSK